MRYFGDRSTRNAPCVTLTFVTTFPLLGEPLAVDLANTTARVRGREVDLIADDASLAAWLDLPPVLGTVDGAALRDLRDPGPAGPAPRTTRPGLRRLGAAHLVGPAVRPQSAPGRVAQHTVHSELSVLHLANPLRS